MSCRVQPSPIALYSSSTDQLHGLGGGVQALPYPEHLDHIRVPAHTRMNGMTLMPRAACDVLTLYLMDDMSINTIATFYYDGVGCDENMHGGVVVLDFEQHGRFVRQVPVCGIQR